MPEPAVKPQYTEADVFIAQFLTANPDLAAGEAGRQAHHAAKRIGLPAMYVEARVYDARKREIEETKRQRAEWLCDFQAAGR